MDIPVNEVIPKEVIDLWSNTDLLDDFNFFAPGEKVNVTFKDLPTKVKLIFKTTMKQMPIYSRPVLSQKFNNELNAMTGVL